MNLDTNRISSEPDIMIEMNMTPLIDVMLVLIIMLIITIPIQNHAVKLNMPTGSVSPPAMPPEVVKIAITADGSVVWNGEALANRLALENKLTLIAGMPTQPEVHLRPDKAVAYKSVAAVLASAQRLGVNKIGLVEGG